MKEVHEPSPYYAVTVDGAPVYTESIRKFDVPIHVARFAATPPNEVSVAVPRAIESYYVGPESRGIDVTPSERRIRFNATRAGPIVVRVNGLGYLFVFADEDDRLRYPDLASRSIRVGELGLGCPRNRVLTKPLQAAIDALSADEDRTYLVFPKGVYRSGTLEMRDNVTLFLEAGAVLLGSDDPRDFPPLRRLDARGEWRDRHAFIVFDGVENAGLAGNGTIDGNGKSIKLQGKSATLLRIENSHKIRVSGLQLRDPSNWNTHVLGSDAVRLESVKILNNVPFANWSNTDGIDPDCSTNVSIDGAFLYCGDDCVAIKGKHPGEAPHDKTEGVRVRNSVCISACAALKIGTETIAETVRDIVFENNDIIFARRGLVIEAFDRTAVRNVVFRNIRIEALNHGPGIHTPMAIELRVPARAWRPCAGESVIENVVFEDVSVDDPAPSVIAGRTDEYCVRNVAMRNLRIGGRLVKNPADANIETNDFVEELVFHASEDRSD